MSKEIWVAGIIAAAIVLSTYIYVQYTRYVFSDMFSQNPVIYKMDRSNGQVWLVVGVEQSLVEESKKTK